MGDLFHEDVHWSTTATIFDVMARTPQHTYLVLTKRPALMQAFLAWYVVGSGVTSYHWPFDNVWLGTTIESPDQSYRADHLRWSPAAVRFLSLEPLLGTFKDYPGTFDDMSWVIVGGETGPGRREMSADWARNVRDQCRAAGVPFFFKRMGNGPTPDDLRIREWPGG
jgi:protein gp37